MALNLTPYFESLGVPQSVLRRDERGNVIGVGDMAIVPRQQQPIANRSTIMQAIEILRQALPTPAEGIQGTLDAIRHAAPQLGEIAQQLPTTLQARNVAATHTGMLPTGQPTEARRHAMAMEAAQRASIAAQQRANQLREQQQRFSEAQALANTLLGISSAGQTIQLTPEQEAALGPFSGILSGATLPMSETGGLEPGNLVTLQSNLMRQLETLNDPMNPNRDDPGVQALRGTIQAQLDAINAQLFPALYGPPDPLQEEVELMRASGMSDNQIWNRLLQVGFTPEEAMQAGVVAPILGEAQPGATPAPQRVGLLDRLARNIGSLGIFGR